MDNQIKKIYDITSLEKDIRERVDIINWYIQTGILDRNDVVKKIMELRIKDEEVKKVLVASPPSGISLEELNNEGLIAELKIQIEILRAELVRKTENSNDCLK